MSLNLLYFARIRERLGLSEERWDAATPATVADLITALAARGETWRETFDGSQPVMVAVNEQMASRETALRDGDTVALFPRVTGG